MLDHATDSPKKAGASVTWQAAWKVTIVLLLALVIGRFLVLGSHKVLMNYHSSDGDESAYLSLGLALKESGTLSDGTRPPLYPAVLALFAERTWAYFTTAKWVTLGLSALAVGATFLVGLVMFGWEAALLAAFLLAINKEFHARAVTIYADNLLLLIMLGCWYFLIKSLEGWKNCVLGGIFVGLAFLTKGSAPLLLVAWGLTALLHFRLTIFRHAELLLVPLFFVITALPLLTYNANQFGSPTYNFATNHIMWMDQLEEINTADPADLPTAATYFATHDRADIVARIQKGLRRLHPTISETVIPSREFEPAWLGPALAVATIGILAFLLLFNRRGLIGYLRRRKNILIFTFFLFGFFYLSLIWYVAGSSSETRFIIPFLGPLYLLLADMLVNLTRGLGRWLAVLEARRATPRILGRVGLFRAGLGLVIALFIGWAVWVQVDTARAEAWALTLDSYEADRSANAEEEKVVQWLAADKPEGEALVFFGPSKSLPLWKFPARFTLERLPSDITTWEGIQAYVQRRSPAYIIIDDDTARRRREALSGYFGREEGLVRFGRLPPGWTLAYVQPSIPCRWCIFSPTPAEETPPLATLEHSLELLGWNVNGQSSQFTVHNSQLTIPAGQNKLRVTLTWQASSPPPADYTIFVHLTAPDGFVKTQQDQPPFDGARPTSLWQPGETYADRYELTLDAGVIPGDYLLLAGMYNPETGQRLAVLDGPTGPAPATVLLGRIEITGE
jgi:4-amino-4-deoxy-L-arabinose transferase-like glycosyltransferase